MIGRRKAAGILAAAALAAGTANAATPATVQRSHFHKQWDLQFFAPRVPEDPSLRTPDVSPIGKFEIDDAPARPTPPTEPAIEFPADDNPANWGWFRFWNGAWWATTFTMKEAQWQAFEFPREGMRESLHNYRNLWLRQRREIPAGLQGSRLGFRLADLKNCDAVLFVNRKRVGVIYRTEGELDITQTVAYGKENEFLIFITSTGLGLPPVEKSTFAGLRKGMRYDPARRVDFLLTGAPPELIVYPPTYLADVFANTSWRRQTLILESEIASAAAKRVRFEAVVKDAAGREVKRVAQEVELQPGTTTIKPEIPWEDPVLWEFDRGYLYTLEAALVDGGARLEYPPFRFGFREIWREGREIMMNGHKQRFRTVYSYGANLHGADFLHDIGFNVIHLSHRIEPDPKLDTDFLYGLAERGMGAVVPMPGISYHQQESVWRDPDIAEDYARCIARNLRRYRNIPSIVLCYFGVNNIVPSWSMNPQWIAGGGTDGWKTELANRTADAGRKVNPNVLFFSHADGNCADIASHNLYLNFTPLQEREEWLSHWSRRGRLPYQAAEFGAPYFQSWYKDGVFLQTEYTAIYYGEDVYRDEPPDILRRTRPGVYIRRVQSPNYWRFIRDFVWRTNRAWRTFGLNGGLVYFNLEEGYGMPGWHYLDKLWNEYGVNYGALKEKVEGRPGWAWPSYDLYQLGNHNFLGYIGGWPKHTDKTHAYRAGEEIAKQAVFLWDYCEPGTFTADWVAALENGTELARGSFRHTMKIGETLFDKLAFTAPDVQAKTAGTLRMVFRDGTGRTLFEDKLDFEVHPPYRRAWGQTPEIALIDPDGTAGKILDNLGITRYRKVAGFRDLGEVRHVIVGKNALDSVPCTLTPDRIEAGLRVLILPQRPGTWRAMGFDVVDSMSRAVFLRDTVSPAYRDVTRDVLHDWRGFPDYGAEPNSDGEPYGPIMGHPTRRGPRWTRNMTVAGLMLKSPDAVGFLPQVEGEFDMNYAAVLRQVSGRGALTFCTLDLEGRVGADPAATVAGDAVLADFLLSDGADHARGVSFSGATASNLVATVLCEGHGLGAAPPPPDGVTVVGPDSTLAWKDVADAARRGARVLVYCHTNLAAAAGIRMTSTQGVYRVGFDRASPLLRGLGPAQFRWRDCFDYAAFVAAPAGFTIDAGGMIASGQVGAGQVVFCQMDPPQFRRRLFPWEGDSARQPKDAGPDLALQDNTAALALEEKGKSGQPSPDDIKRANGQFKNVQPSLQRCYQIYARLLTNLGAHPGRAPTARALWLRDIDRTWAPLKPVAARGPLGAGQAAGAPLLETPLAAEADAVAGRIQPETAPSGGSGESAGWSGTRLQPDHEGRARFRPFFDKDDASPGIIYAVYEIDAGGHDGCELKVSSTAKLKLWFNGAVRDPDQPADTRKIRLSLPLRPGRNILAVKYLAEPKDDVAVTGRLLKNGQPIETPFVPDEVSARQFQYYNPVFPDLDPYLFTYW